MGLINDILDMSKIESGNIELHPEYYSYHEFSDYIEAIMRPLCDKKGIHFHRDDRIDVLLLVDKLRFNQICFNLLSNAVKYTQEGGEVKFILREISRNQKEVTIEMLVSDNGMGMSPEFMNHLFDEFTQEERKGEQDTIQGTGLGLAIVNRLVQLMGGTIFVESKEEVGSTFRVVLTCPYMAESEIQLPKEEKKQFVPMDFRGKKILLCEDNHLNAEIAMRILTNRGLQVFRVYNGQEAVKEFHYSNPGTYDAVIMDIRMPIMDGLEATRQIRELERPDARQVPIIAMSANAFEEDRHKSILAGMNAHLAKPIVQEELFRTLAEVMNS